MKEQNPCKTCGHALAHGAPGSPRIPYCLHPEAAKHDRIDGRMMMTEWMKQPGRPCGPELRLREPMPWLEADAS